MDERMRDADARDASDRAQARQVDEHIREMLRLARGIIADGEVTEGETLALASWLSAHPGALEEWPANVLAARLGAILQDGIIGPDERTDLMELLRRVLGEEAPVTPALLDRLPFDDPIPAVVFPGRVFVLVGRFAKGTNQACTRVVRSLGGFVETAVEPHTDYLVVGGLTRDDSRPDLTAALKAVAEQRHAGSATAIIREKHWVEAMP